MSLHSLATLELGLLLLFTFWILFWLPVLIQLDTDDASGLALRLYVSERINEPILRERGGNASLGIHLAFMGRVPYSVAGHGINKIDRGRAGCLGQRREEEEVRVEVLVESRAVAHDAAERCNAASALSNDRINGLIQIAGQGKRPLVDVL